MADEIYKRFDELRKLQGVTVYAVSKATGITTTTFTNWKNGKYTPKRDKMELISQYFNVSVDYLMTGKEPQFTIEMADIDAELIMQEKRLKEYFLKIAEMTSEQKEYIMSTIDFVYKGCKQE